MENQEIVELEGFEKVTHETATSSAHADSLFIVKNPYGDFWRAREEGYTPIPGEAFRYTGRELRDIGIPDNQTFYLLKTGNSAPEKQADETSLVRKSKMSDHFNIGFIAMLQAAPKNQGLRAHIMKSLLQMAPDEIVTYAALRDWVEFNFEPKPKPHKKYGKKSDGPALELGFTSSEREHGRCDYIRNVNGTGTYRFSVDELRRLIEDEELGIEPVLEELAEMARENGDFDYEHDDEETSDHEAGDCDGQTVRHERDSRAADAVRNFLEANAPDLLAKIDENEQG